MKDIEMAAKSPTRSPMNENVQKETTSLLQ